MRRSTSDKTAISVLYDQWGNSQGLEQPLAGAARDIGVSANGAVWVIGTDTNGDGYRIYNLVGNNSWTEASGNGAATRIAVASDGTPWVIGSNGGVFTHSAAWSTGGWSYKEACGVDIGTGADGSVWLVSCETINGGYRIYKWNGSGWTRDAANGGAVRISVDDAGKPWVVNNAMNIYRRSSNDANTGSWSQVSGASAIDIAVSPHGYAWIASFDWTLPSTTKIRVWNEQAAIDGKTRPPAASGSWYPAARQPSPRARPPCGTSTPPIRSGSRSRRASSERHRTREKLADVAAAPGDLQPAAPLFDATSMFKPVGPFRYKVRRWAATCPPARYHVSMLVLHVSATFSLTPQQLTTWQSAFDESVAIDELSSSELGPLHVALLLGGTYQPDDVITGLIAAFARIGIVQGNIEIALSEHPRDDRELETPPFYEREIDLARGPEPDLAHVQVEIMQSEPFTTAQLEVLERELRAHLKLPVESFGPVSPALKGRHCVRLELVPMPEEQLPARAELKESTLRALLAAQFRPLRVTVGAYVGTWDNTLFKERL